METKLMTRLVLMPSPYMPGGMIVASQFSDNLIVASPGPEPDCCSAHGRLSDWLL